MKKEEKIKHNRAVKRQVDLELGINPPKHKIYRNKKKYTRKSKHTKPIN